MAGYELIIGVYIFCNVYICVIQAELDSAQSQNTQADTRSAALARQCSALEIQLTEAQQATQNDAQHQAELQAQLRTVESHAAGLREQLDEQTEVAQQQEAKIQAQNAQVGCCISAMNFRF